jgi:cystathionine gamma-synthase
VYLVIADVFAQWGMTMEKVDFTDLVAVRARLQSLYATGNDDDQQGDTKRHRDGEQQHRRLVLWMETPSNPLCKVTDVEAVSSMARELFPSPEELTVVVDSTWATPYLLNPLQLGADFALHSITKYVAGHSDVLGGVVTASNAAVQRADQAEKDGRRDVLATLRTVNRVGGGVCGPLESWLAARGLRTLPLRLNHQCQR